MESNEKNLKLIKTIDSNNNKTMKNEIKRSYSHFSKRKQKQLENN
jgi:hypothetical protein